MDERPPIEDDPPADDGAPIAPARPRDVLVLVGEARTKSWLGWIRKGEASKAGLVAMAARSLARKPGTRGQTPRGHGAKIEAALAALEARGKLPPHLRACELYRLVTEELKEQGYGRDLMPSRDAVRRHAERCISPRGPDMT